MNTAQDTYQNVTPLYTHSFFILVKLKPLATEHDQIFLMSVWYNTTPADADYQ